MAAGLEAGEPSALVDFVAGTAAGIASLLAGHPFDTIKTRLQAQSQGHGSAQLASGRATPSSQTPLLGQAPSAAAAPGSGRTPVSSSLALPSSTRHYASAVDALRRIVAEERFVGLYKGVTSPMLGVAISNACIFGSYGLALRLLDAGGSSGGRGEVVDTHSFAPGGDVLQGVAPSSVRSSPALSSIFLAGCASGIVSSLVTAPIDLIKIRQQLSLELGYGPYFLVYEVLNRALLASKDGADSTAQLTNIELAISGGLAGVVAWLSTFPADVVKTRVQATERNPTTIYRIFSTSAFLHAARSTYAEGGWRAFFAGVGPTVVRALPVNAAMFVTFEAAKDALMSAGF